MPFCIELTRSFGETTQKRTLQDCAQLGALMKAAVENPYNSVYFLPHSKTLGGFPRTGLLVFP